ncbi:MAG: hypothetical protein EOP00_12050 [Pedobacter sp.]|nr:MAG: hypothetical protein EOP00_12050 [Pedobacter sp.]
MKNLLKNTLLVAIMLTSSVVFAKDGDFSLKVKSENEKSVVFYIDEAQDVNLSISSVEEGIIYEQKIHAEKALSKVYSLEEFPDGNYTFKLESATGVVEYPVNILNGKAFMSKAIVKENFKPILIKESNIITLDLKTVPHGPVEIKVFNEDNEELYAKSFASKMIAVKKFNIGQTNAKSLTFIVKSKNQEYIETINVK